MKIPTIQGIIERRMLVNYTADPAVIQKIVPSPFRPKVFNGKAIVGICLIRLRHIRPKGLPAFIGINSENGAHRIAVEWDDNSIIKEGVFIPRRDTSSMMNHLAGGRVFPGKHYHAVFDVKETAQQYHISFKSSDDTGISIDAEMSESFDRNSIFENIENASGFFKAGSIGYSPNGTEYEGLQLHTLTWSMKPLKVTNVYSSFFEDGKTFPSGSINFDNALLMTDIKHEWKSVENKYACLED